MRILLLFVVASVCLVNPILAEVAIDGVPTSAVRGELPPNTYVVAGNMVDVVGGTDFQNTATGRAKGNSYRIDTGVVLQEAEFWLDFTGSQMLTYYVFESPVEFGTYSEVFRASAMVAGSGAGWYSTGAIAVTLSAGSYYIIAVSWNGSLTYFYTDADSQPVSFGEYVHGYAVGFDPLPTSFDSAVNDQAVYHQRLTTMVLVPTEGATWGAIKALYR